MKCRICGSTEGERHIVQERMFGTGEEFLYLECAQCGCLQLENPPSDLSPYYPSDRYYSFQGRPDAPPVGNPFRRWIKRTRDAGVLFERGGIAARLARRRPNPGIADVKSWLAPTAVRSFDSPILDVGCGGGGLLFRLRDLGFRSLTGIDPYCSEEIDSPHLRIFRGPLEQLVEGKFDLVMFHHSFEHVPNPREVLQSARSVLTDRGVCLIRLPIASRGPWRIYGTDWAELDAPRHFFLHTEFSMSRLAHDAGLYLAHIDYEPEPFSYGASEMYRRGISLYSKDQGRMLSWQEAFSPEEIARFEEMARTYNVPGWAGRAAFYLTRKPADSLSVEFAPM